jgi:hypothetical protein
MTKALDAAGAGTGGGWKHKYELAMDEIATLRRQLEEAKHTEAEHIVACIRSTTWSGTEEIVAMIRARSASSSPRGRTE